MKQNLWIVKIGGEIAEDDILRESFLMQFAQLPMPKILVHGGGKAITQMCAQLNIETTMVNGRRITSPENMDVVLMTCAGKISKKLVARLQTLNHSALGISGADLGLVMSRKREPQPIDYGMVGDVESVDAVSLTKLLNLGIVPVFAPVTINNKGELLNTNADTMAGKIAEALGKEYNSQLYFYFVHSGVKQDIEIVGHFEQINPEQLIDLQTAGIVHSGMMPKLQEGFNALKAGVSSVVIGNCLHPQPKGTALMLKPIQKGI